MIMNKGDRVFRRTYTSIYDLDKIEVGLLIEAINSQIEIYMVNERPVAADRLKELKVEIEERGGTVWQNQSILMSRCKACNAKLTETELYYKNPNTGQLEELCSSCINSLYEYDIDVEDKEVLQLIEKNGIIYIEE